MKQKKSYFSGLLLLAFSIYLSSCGGGPLAVQSLPSDVKLTGCTSDLSDSLTTNEFKTWFVDDTVSLNGVVEPANSLMFSDKPNMSFYKWAEQMFLWLTSPAPPSYGGGKNLVFNSNVFFDVTAPDPVTFKRKFVPHRNGAFKIFDIRSINRGVLGLPIAVEKKSKKQFEILPSVTSRSGKPIVLDINNNEVEVAAINVNKEKQKVLIDINGKIIERPRALIASKQIKSDSKLLDRIQRMTRLEQLDRKTLIQKITIGKQSIFLDLFGNTVEVELNQADGNVLMAQNHSLVYYTLSVNNVFMLYRSMLGTSVPAGTKFPVTAADLNAISIFANNHHRTPIIDSVAMAVEIKVAWVIADSLPNPDSFIKIKGEVPIYDMTDPNHWIKTGTKKVTLAMVGMHVVGSTGSTNPANSNHGHPEMLWATFEHQSNTPSAAYNYNKSPSGVGNMPQNTVGNWVFCQSGSTGPFNEPHISVSGSDLVNVGAHTISPSNILRSMPFGMPGTSSCSNSQIISLNNKVINSLKATDIRKNYFHIGTTWTIFGGTPSGDGHATFGNQVGTNRLSNTTMETFTQGDNCFSCHRTNTVDVSHIFAETDPLVLP